MMPVPIFSVSGGLGNQLFQWFAAHSITKNQKFIIRPIFPSREVFQSGVNDHRSFELSPLELRCEHAEILNQEHRFTDFFCRLMDWSVQFPRLTFFTRFLGYLNENPRIKSSYQYKPLLNLRYVSGSFQDYNYVEDVSEVIDSELSESLDSLFHKLQIQFKIPSNFTVAHIRRGDYRVDKNPETMIGVLSDAYYDNFFRLKVHSEFTILLVENSEEILDLVDSIKPDLVLDKHNTNAWDCLAIMSRSSLFLGANSTLSFWGAYIASKKGARVYLPSEWDIAHQFDTNKYIFPGCLIHPANWE